MESNQPPFTLQKVDLLEASFRRNDVYPSEYVQNRLQLEISRRTELPLLFVILEVEIWQEHGTDKVMESKIKMGGQFSVAEGVDEKLLENFSDINAPAILFPFVRETIASLTARAGIPTVLVQPFNFVDMQRRKQNQAKENQADEEISEDSEGIVEESDK
ncbi:MULTISPECIES: protein-export chaperone SecB [Larkinella]|jgi:preprotein translocase subunit SecB|uniref:Preprotein translocase subunit SecB n=1 Tax=Larkinella humicola TaxID=2607654 RepID=A0A5N1JN60_9BACT|nr:MULTISPECIES: protein-export chaperone SecB [Larkinella]KAA9356877.1 hypothetical protein F0P93_03815 [Larkinella humicola]